MKVRITLTEEILGTASANPDVHREFIASKSADADKAEEELRALHADELAEKAKTVFPRSEDGKPLLWDYQMKGFLKDTIGLLLEVTPGQVTVGKTKVTKWTFKRVVDNYVFVWPRRWRTWSGRLWTSGPRRAWASGGTAARAGSRGRR